MVWPLQSSSPREPEFAKTCANLVRYLVAEKAFSRIQVFEQRHNVGGIWNYVPCPESAPKDMAIPQTNSHAGLDQPIWEHSNATSILGKEDRERAQFLSPLYDRLETNIPRGLMGFSDLPWPDDSQLFPKHDTVQEYIEAYSQDVRHLIQFETQVVDVRQDAAEKWLVKTKPVKHESRVEEHTFDAVIVANGHFAVPYLPPVQGIEAWSQAHPGVITHSIFYRKPEHFAGKKVLIVGNSASGIDIGGQIKAFCQQPIIVSAKSVSYMQTEPPEDQVNKPAISEFILEGRTLVFEDGSRESNIDAVLYCTGYFYSFPFLESMQPPLTTTGERVENLYQHVFYRPQPTLAFTALNQKVIPFPLSEAQGAVIARAFAGRLPLPDESEMKQWEDGVISEMGSGGEFHVLQFPKDADYIDMMHDWAMSADGEAPPASTIDGYCRRRSVTSASKPGIAIVGKEPPYWGEQEYWTREQFPAIKKAFQSFGEERHNVRTLKEVGFDFDEYKQRKKEEGKRLL